MVTACNDCIVQNDVLNCCIHNHTENALVAILIIITAHLFQTDTTDGISLTIEDALEFVMEVSNRGVVLTILIKVVGIVFDVMFQLEEFVLIGISLTHQICQQIDACGCSDDVGSIFCRSIVISIGMPPSPEIWGHGDINPYVFSWHGKRTVDAGTLVGAVSARKAFGNIGTTQHDSGVAGVVSDVVKDKGLAAGAYSVIIHRNGVQAVYTFDIAIACTYVGAAIGGVAYFSRAIDVVVLVKGVIRTVIMSNVDAC